MLVQGSYVHLDLSEFSDEVKLFLSCPRKKCPRFNRKYRVRDMGWVDFAFDFG